MKIFINNIVIPQSATLYLKVYNPMFNSIGGYSFPVTFNARLPVIRRAFGYPGIIAAEGSVEVPGKIKIEMAEFLGTWKVTDASEEVIEAYFAGSAGSFYSLVGDKLLTELSFGGVKYPVGILADPETVLAHMDAKMNAIYPNDEYCSFCAYMPNAYGEETADTYKWVNEVEHDSAGNPSFKDKGGNLGNDTVYLFAGTVIDYLFEEHGYRIAKNIFRTDSELRRLVIFNAYNRKSSQAFDYGKLVPSIKCTEFLAAITARFNIGFFINENSRVVDVMLFDDLTSKPPKEVRSRFLSLPMVDARRTPGLYFPLNPPDDYSDHDIDSINDFYPFTPITVNKVRDIAAGTFTLNQVYFVRSESAYYRVVYEEGNYITRRECSANLPYRQGSNYVEVAQYSGIPSMYTHTVEISWIVMEYDDPPIPIEHFTDVDYVIPRCDLECAEILYPNKEYPLMFLFTRGIRESYIVPEVENPTTLKYPLGTVDVYDARGISVSGASMTLNWTGTGGLIDLWSSRISWELNKKKIVRAEISIDDLDQLIDFSQIVRIGNDNFIVVRLDLEIGRKTVKITEAELFRM